MAEISLSTAQFFVLKLCPVCCTEQRELYSLAACNHYFCQSCCLSYISTQANNFAVAQCLEEGCHKQLDHRSQIFGRISAQTRRKINKFESFVFLQKNPTYMACKKEDCSGYLLKKGPKNTCDLCSTVHCKRCYSIKHEGVCTVSEDVAIMKALRYQQCPYCTAWVQKVKGCTLVICKCGNQFCFICGSKPENDLCKKIELYKEQQVTRKLMDGLHVATPTSIADIPCFLVKIPIKILLTFLTIFSALFIGMLLILGLELAFLAFGSFGFLFMLMGKMNRCIGAILFVFMYPFLFFFCVIILFILTASYICCRRSGMHGIYDFCNQMLAKLVNGALRIAVELANW